MESYARRTIDMFSSATEKMKEITQPLILSGVPHFSIIRSFDNGYFVNLSNIDGWIEHYYQNKLYLSSCFENHPSKYFSQIYWHDRLSGDVIDVAIDVFDSCNGVTIIDRRYDHTSFYFFSSSKKTKNIDNFYVNNLGFLYQYLHQFNRDAKSLIARCIAKNRQHIYGTMYINNPLPNNIDQTNKGKLIDTKRITSHDSVSFNITPKEAGCLSYLLKGLSCKEIAQKRCISPRTVEQHIFSLKKKFGCKTTVSLIATMYTQQQNLAISLLHADHP